MEVPDLKAIRRTFSRVGLACTAFFVISTLCQLIAALALQGVRQQLGENLWTFLCMLAMYPLAVAVCLLIMSTAPKGPAIRRYPMTPLRFLGILIICVGLMFVGNIIGQMMMLIVSLLTGRPMVNAIEELLTNMNVWSVLVLAVIIAPIVEETIFRKFLMDRLIPCGQFTAVILSGGMFGLAHGNFYQFFYAFALGLVFAYVYLRTGKVRYTIALHMMINFLGSIIPMALLDLIGRHPFLASYLLAGDYMMMTGCALCALILLIMHRKDVWFEKSWFQVPAGKWLKTVLLNVGMISFLIYCFLSFLLA